MLYFELVLRATTHYVAKSEWWSFDFAIFSGRRAVRRNRVG